jgi:hypothetical protein
MFLMDSKRLSDMLLSFHQEMKNFAFDVPGPSRRRCKTESHQDPPLMRLFHILGQFVDSVKHRQRDHLPYRFHTRAHRRRPG